MAFNFPTAKMLADRIKRDYNGKVTKAQLAQLLREVTGSMDSRWIRRYAESMNTAGLIEEVENGIFGVVEK